MINIVGLGPGDPGLITQATLNLLKNSEDIRLRTAIHPGVDALAEAGITYTAYDDYYDTYDTFEAVYAAIVGDVVKAGKNTDLVYAVPGHPLCAETTVTQLLEACKKEGIETHIHAGVSFIDTTLAAVGVDPVNGFALLDAMQLTASQLDITKDTLITQVYNGHVASEVKLLLMEAYADEAQVAVVTAAGVPGEEQLDWVPLYQMDRLPHINHLTTVYIPGMPEDQRQLSALTDVMTTLRAPGGCNWDREQTHESLKPYLIEECYEVVDAIDTDDVDNLIEELGDVLLQIVFHAQLGKEAGLFSMGDVIQGVTEKMITRHPHIFKQHNDLSPDAVDTQWDAIKRAEKQTKTLGDELDRIPNSFTALLRAEKMESRASKVGFDWDDPMLALTKVTEETQEVAEALSEGDAVHIEEEIGDLLFAVTNVARLAGVQSELALKKAGDKFIARLKGMERLAKQDEKTLKDYDLTGLDALWDRVKAEQA